MKKTVLITSAGIIGFFCLFTIILIAMSNNHTPGSRVEDNPDQIQQDSDLPSVVSDDNTQNDTPDTDLPIDTVEYADKHGDIQAFNALEGTKNATTADTYELQTVYTGEDNWEYIIIGTLPTPCYDVSVDTVILESFPEQVQMVLHIYEPGPAETCIAQIEEITVRGNFQASEQATLTAFKTEEHRTTTDN